jgi:enamine deaminase RidA (YjgF/YER057c/UK114 family)
MQFVNPDTFPPPRGYNNGVLVGPGRLLFVAGQIGWDGHGRLVGPQLADQFDQALGNVLAVVERAGGTPRSLAKLTIYVTSRAEYVEARREIGERYRRRMGGHYPAMALVEVRALLEPGATVEIEAVAVIDTGPAIGG